MNCATFGNGSLLVSLHPIGLNRGMWEEFVPHLGKRHRVVSIDLPGHGSAVTVPLAWTISAIADAVMPALLSLSDEYALLGASLGGMVAQELSLRNLPNLRMLILADTLSRVMPQHQLAIRQRADDARQHGMAALMEETIQRWFTSSFIRECQEPLARVRSILASNNAEVHAACWEAIAAFDIEDRLPAIPVPVRTIVGAEDSSTPPSMAQSIADRVSDGQCRIISDAAHMSMIEKPAEFAETVFEFTSQ
jgi:pimeloyl-ACP methyl ester carboxylesterase